MFPHTTTHKAFPDHCVHMVPCGVPRVGVGAGGVQAGCKAVVRVNPGRKSGAWEAVPQQDYVPYDSQHLGVRKVPECFQIAQLLA